MGSGQIDLGDHGWKHPGLQGVTYASEKAIRWEAKRNGLDEDEVFESDTRPTVKKVAQKIAGSEEHVWDEYFSVNHVTGSGDKWPDGRICVFVVTGGSEGLYLHIEVKDGDETKCLILGKTLSCSVDKWYECWMSAARIARMLGA